MKNYRIQLALFAFILLSGRAMSQSYDVPVSLKLEKAEDYKQYEKNVINCVKWLEATPVNEETEKRLSANKFLITWIEGAPNVSIMITFNVTSFSEKNPELLMSFMGGWTKYVLETGDTTQLKGNLAGVQSAIRVYKNNTKNLKKDKKMEELIKISDEGKLEEWVKTQLAKT